MAIVTNPPMLWPDDDRRAGDAAGVGHGQDLVGPLVERVDGRGGRCRRGRTGRAPPPGSRRRTGRDVGPPVGVGAAAVDEHEAAAARLAPGQQVDAGTVDLGPLVGERHGQRPAEPRGRVGRTGARRPVGQPAGDAGRETSPDTPPRYGTAHRAAARRHAGRLPGWLDRVPRERTERRGSRPTARSLRRSPALAAALVVAVAATGAGLLLPGADLTDGRPRAVRAGALAVAVIGLVALATRVGGPRPRPAAGAPRHAAGRRPAARRGDACSPPRSRPIDIDNPERTTTTAEPTTTTTVRSTTTRRPSRRPHRRRTTTCWCALAQALALSPLLALVVYAAVRLLGPGRLAAWWRAAMPGPPEVGPGTGIDVAAAEAGLESSLDAVTTGCHPATPSAMPTPACWPRSRPPGRAVGRPRPRTSTSTACSDRSGCGPRRCTSWPSCSCSPASASTPSPTTTAPAPSPPSARRWPICGRTRPGSTREPPRSAPPGSPERKT